MCGIIIVIIMLRWLWLIFLQTCIVQPCHHLVTSLKQFHCLGCCNHLTRWCQPCQTDLVATLQQPWHFHMGCHTSRFPCWYYLGQTLPSFTHLQDLIQRGGALGYPHPPKWLSICTKKLFLREKILDNKRSSPSIVSYTHYSILVDIHPLPKILYEPRIRDGLHANTRPHLTLFPCQHEAPPYPLVLHWWWRFPSLTPAPTLLLLTEVSMSVYYSLQPSNSSATAMLSPMVLRRGKGLHVKVTWFTHAMYCHSKQPAGA